MRIHTLALLVAATAAPPPAPTLKVTGPGGTLPLDVQALRLLSVQRVTATDPHSRETAVYTGVPLMEVVALVGAPRGRALTGDAMATYVVAEAADDYRAVFSMAELDADFRDTHAYVTFEQDDKPLDPEIGPFRLVVPSDKRGERWVRQVVRLTVAGAPGKR